MASNSPLLGQNFESENGMGRKSTFDRPTLPFAKHVVYEDTGRTNQVLNEMHRFYRDERWVDVVLLVEGCKFPSHRLVLAATSTYFERMFTNGMCEERQTEITLNGISATALNKLLEFSYTSKLELNSDCVLEVFEAADMFQFTTARKFCQEFLYDQICEENCLSFMVYSDTYSSEALYGKAKHCAAKHFKSLCDTADFLRLPMSHVLTLLQEDNLEMEYEEHVFEAMKRWILSDLKERQPFLPELFKCIRLNYVSRWYLIEVISKDELITESDVARNHIESTKDQLLAQGHTYEIPWQLPASRKCTGLTTKVVFVDTMELTQAEYEVLLFDVVNKSWSSTNKPCPRASEFSTIETVGDLLVVVGGWNNQGVKLNERGAMNTVQTFKVNQIFPTLWYLNKYKMGISRYLHSSVTVGKTLYIIGGYDESHSLQATLFRTECIENSDGEYTTDVCPRLLYPVCRPAVAGKDSRIYAFGGFGEGGVPRQFVQCYDLNSRQWSEIRPGIPGYSTSCHYAAFIDNLFYLLCCEGAQPQGILSAIVGHVIPERAVDSVYTFNPSTREWRKMFTFQEKRKGSFCCATIDGKIYITGGESNDGSRILSVDCYDPGRNIFYSVGHTKSGCLSLCTTMKVLHENVGL